MFKWEITYLQGHPFPFHTEYLTLSKIDPGHAYWFTRYPILEPHMQAATRMSVRPTVVKLWLSGGSI